MIVVLWKKWLLQRCSWAPTVSFIPILYLLGWLIVQPLLLLPYEIALHSLSLLGTVLTFILFLVALPSWAKYRWRQGNPFISLGLNRFSSNSAAQIFFKTCFLAACLVCFVLIPLFLGQWVEWRGEFSLATIMNGICLGIGVGVAEELIFRGWLWNELNCFFGFRKSTFFQAIIFSFAHVGALEKGNLDFLEICLLFFGLFLLGLVLALRRIIDHGSLIGCIGIHGGLVGSWFLANFVFLDISSEIPTILIGPGNLSPNPIGSLIGILGLSVILVNYWKAFAIAGRPFNGERKASFKDAAP